MINLLKQKDYIEISQLAGVEKHWYGWVRGWTNGKDIFINIDAFYIDNIDFNLLIQHEEGHISGKEHTFFGVMSAYGLIRRLSFLW